MNEDVELWTGGGTQIMHGHGHERSAEKGRRQLSLNRNSCKFFSHCSAL